MRNQSDAGLPKRAAPWNAAEHTALDAALGNTASQPSLPLKGKLLVIHANTKTYGRGGDTASAGDDHRLVAAKRSNREDFDFAAKDYIAMRDGGVYSGDPRENKLLPLPRPTYTEFINRAQRAKALDDFQKDPPTTVFLLSIRAGAVGINLTQANQVFLLEPCLNPALEAQAIGRVHRMGQTRPVSVYRLMIRGSVDEAMQRAAEEIARQEAEQADETRWRQQETQREAARPAGAAAGAHCGGRGAAARHAPSQQQSARHTVHTSEVRLSEVREVRFTQQAA